MTKSLEIIKYKSYNKKFNGFVNMNLDKTLETWNKTFYIQHPLQELSHMWNTTNMSLVAILYL
jgi:hypothetical protein